MHGFGVYKQESSILNVEEIKNVIKGITTTFVIVLMILVFGKLLLSRYVIFFSYIFSLICLVTEKTLFYHLPTLTKTSRKLHKRILIYGAGEIGQSLYRDLFNSPKLNVVPVGFIDDDPDKQNKIFFRSGFNSSEGLRVLGTWKDIKHLTETLDIDEIYVAISNNPHETLSNILEFLKKEKIKASFVPNLSKIFIHKLQISQIGQIPLVREMDDEIKTPYVYIKPYVDFFLCAVGLILLFPLFLIITVAIKFDSKGPALFKHDRVGKDGKIFKMYKFRTMYTDVEPYAVNPLDQDDPRITGVGKYLRKTSMDELPQLINILKGEMSLVGPRPEMPFIVAEYNEIHRERLKVLPGITGLWQLSGDRGKAIHENMDYDLYYIRNMSLFLDIAILIETFIFAFRGI
jgi:exopolysaccharide biosynthesis polyprenyl glycosylphosphotransferase